MTAAVLQLVAIFLIAFGVARVAMAHPGPLTWARREWQWWRVKRRLERHAARQKVGEVTRRIRK